LLRKKEALGGVSFLFCGQLNLFGSGLQLHDPETANLAGSRKTDTAC
jgi:hypothetical protein